MTSAHCTIDGASWTYYEPRFLHDPGPTAAWGGHRRFGYDLVRNLRPRRIVELGVLMGTSFFAFAQAVKEASLPTELFAVDTWQGDPHTGFYGEEFLSKFDAVWREHFGDLAIRQVRKPFDDARADFALGSVDLLHIDGCHTYEAARHDYETWQDAVSEDGVVLFHDIAVRDRDFGVFRLWEELRREHAGVEFAHSHGLGVLLPPSLAALGAHQDKWRARYEAAG